MSEYAYRKRTSEFNEALQSALIAELAERRAVLIDDQNVFSYRHGAEWSTSHSEESRETSQMVTASVEVEIPLFKIRDHDVSAIEDYLSKTADELQGQFMKNMVELLDRTVARTGNSVSAEQGFEGAFIEMLKKIEFGVNRLGLPTRPSILMHPHMVSTLRKASLEATPEIMTEVERITAEKEAAAIAREATRISRFRI